MNRKEIIEKLKREVIENDYFLTDAGMRFKELYGVENIKSAIAVAGRSKTRESFLLKPEPESDSEDTAVYITHLSIDRCGDLKINVCDRDDDDFHILVENLDYYASEYDTETLKELADLLL